MKTKNIISQSFKANNVEMFIHKCIKLECRPDWVKVFCRIYETPIGQGGV